MLNYAAALLVFVIASVVLGVGSFAAAIDALTRFEGWGFAMGRRPAPTAEVLSSRSERVP